MNQIYSLREAANLIGVKPHRLAYACAAGLIAEPQQRLTNHRMFTPSDIKMAKQYFANPAKAGRPKGE